jgi:bacillithiol synthase
MSAPRVETEPLGGTPLSVMIQRGLAPAEWGVALPASADEWRGRLISASASAPRWLETLRGAFSATGAAAERLERTARDNGAVITTGQQPGLFGGPIYTWSKAISALALADYLEERTGVCVCPVFWAATDDADFEEARSTVVALRGGTLTLRVENAPVSGTPMSEAHLGPISELIRALEAACGSGADQSPLEAIRTAYGRQEATVGGAYLALLRAVLEPLGMPVIDASHPAVRGAARPLLIRAIADSPRVAAALADRDRAIRALGYEPQVETDPDRSLVFALAGGIRTRLPVAAEQADVAEQPLAPNVLLRPIAEAEILPVAAYVAGPAELAYFAQVSAVADVLGTRRPLAAPRWSCTIIEPHIERILQRLSVSADELRDSVRIERGFAEARAPEGLLAALDRWRAAIDAEATEVESLLRQASLPAPVTVEGARLSMRHRIDRLERRALAAVKRRETDLFTDLRTARATLFPDGERQERTLNFMPMLVRHGSALLDRMRHQAGEHAMTVVTGLTARRGVTVQAEL